VRAFLRVVFYVIGTVFGLLFLANLFRGGWGIGSTPELVRLGDTARFLDMVVQGVACVGFFALARNIVRRKEQPGPLRKQPAYQLLDANESGDARIGRHPSPSRTPTAGDRPNDATRPATIPASHPVSWVEEPPEATPTAASKAPGKSELEAARAHLAAAEAKAANAEETAAGLRAAANQARVEVKRLERARAGDVPDSFPYR